MSDLVTMFKHQNCGPTWQQTTREESLANRRRVAAFVIAAFFSTHRNPGQELLPIRQFAGGVPVEGLPARQTAPDNSARGSRNSARESGEFSAQGPGKFSAAQEVDR